MRDASKLKVIVIGSAIARMEFLRAEKSRCREGGISPRV